METNNTPLAANAQDAHDANPRRGVAEHAFWMTIGTLWRRRLFIVIGTTIIAILSVVISLLIPNWYQGTARLLLPTSNGSTGLLAGALSGLPSAAKSILNTGGGDYMRYLAILGSRSVMDAAVEAFDLVTVYETGDSKTPHLNARKILQDNSEFLVDDEYEFLSVNVSDTDPERAAALTNFFVAELNRRNASFTSQDATAYREYIETEYNKNEAGLDSVMNAVRSFQEKYGVLDLKMQGEVFYETAANLRLGVMQAELQYQQVFSEYGADNSQVQAARRAMLAARQQYQNAIEGDERLLPVAQDSLPMVMRQLVDLEKERLILSKLIEFTRPLLEEARYTEQREIEAVQVIDAAVPPERKAGPRRSIICITATLSAFVLIVLYVLLMDWWRRNHSYYAHRLRTATVHPEPTRPDPSQPARSPKTLA